MIKFQRLLKKFDFYGQPVQFSFKGHQLYKTSFGGVVSIILFVIILSFFYSSIIHFLSMTDVQSESYYYFDNNPNRLKLSSKTFMFAIQIDQEDFIQNPFFNITVEQRQFSNLPDGTQKESNISQIDLIQCTKEHFTPIFNKYGINIDEEFSNLNIKNYLCPNINDLNNINYYLRGQQSSQNYEYLQISILPCNQDPSSNFTWKPQCKSESEIQQALEKQNSFKFQMITTNYIVNPKQQNYIQPYLAVDLKYNFVPNQMFVQSEIFMKGKTIQTDNGILMYPDLNTETLGCRDEEERRTQIEINSKNKGSYAVFELKRSPYSAFYQRSFEKLDSLLSYIGGFSQFLIVMVGFFIQFYNKQHYLIALANELFEFDKENRNRRRNTTKNSMINFGTIKDNFKRVQTMTKNIHLATLSDLQKSHQVIYVPQLQSTAKVQASKSPISTQLSAYEKFKQKQSQILCSFRLIFSLVFNINCCANDETILVQKAVYNLQQNLDIIFLIHKTHEIQKLIKVLFNKQQQTLFNVSHKPKISIQLQSKRRKAMLNSYYQNGMNKLDLIQNYHNLVEAYKSIISQSAEAITEEQIRFNERLTQLLGGDLVRILDNEIEKIQQIPSIEEGMI